MNTNDLYALFDNMPHPPAGDARHLWRVYVRTVA